MMEINAAVSAYVAVSSQIRNPEWVIFTDWMHLNSKNEHPFKIDYVWQYKCLYGDPADG